MGQIRLRLILRWLLAAIFVTTGVLHFVHPESFRKIVPPSFPNPSALVAISGVFELLGGISLLIRSLRRVAGWGLILLLIAVFPANIFMATNPRQAGAEHIPQWVLWARLPLQAVLIAWAWYVSGE